MTFEWGGGVGRVGYGSFHKKINLQTDFEGKKFLQGNTWGKKFPRLKKKSFMAYNPGKNITLWYVGEKNSITRGLEKKILTQAKSPIPPLKVKWSFP